MDFAANADEHAANADEHAANADEHQCLGWNLFA